MLPVRLVGAQRGEHGVGQAPAQQSQRCGLVLAAGSLPIKVGATGAAPMPRAWVMAIMCSAQFIARLPPRLRRIFPCWARIRPERGPVPVNRAKASLLRNR